MSTDPQPCVFPPEFIFGVTTAAYQNEGNNVASDWWQWEKIPGKCEEFSGKACNSWELWREDFSLLQELNAGAYRFSIEWSRIEPVEGTFDQVAFDRYCEQIKDLHGRGIKVMLTLWHYSIPQWLAEKGGLEKRSNRKYFVRFVEYVVNNLTEEPDFWITMNEPMLFIMNGYIGGIYPPGKKDPLAAIWVGQNLRMIHKACYRAIHRKYEGAKVGLAFNMYPIEAVGTKTIYGFLIWLLDFFANRMWLGGVRKEQDFLGVNYYFPYIMNWRGFIKKGLYSLMDATARYEESDQHFPIAPKGIYTLLRNLAKYKLPIYITENGISDGRDLKRKAFIFDHLLWIWRARDGGVDVRGYFHHTLIDNFEWVLGYGMKYGLYELNRETSERKPRPSAAFYAKICETHNLDGARSVV